MDINLEMSRYIDLDIYHAVEKTHPYYIEMIGAVARILENKNFASNTSNELNILELGAGTGLSTEEILTVSGVKLDAVELDTNCSRLLEDRCGDRVRCYNGDAVSFRGDKIYDAAISIFAHDHIHSDQVAEFVSNIRRNLKPGGIYIMGGEIIPFYESDDQRAEALHTYHGFIIDKALRDGHFEVAKLEIDALQSGLEMVGDFKRHEAMFENEMLSSEEFELLTKNKIGPLDRENVGGIYVYVFQAK